MNIHFHDRIARTNAQKSCAVMLRRMLATGHYWPSSMAAFNARHAEKGHGQ